MKLTKVKPALFGIGVTISQAVFQFLVLSVLALEFGIEKVGSFSFINAILIVVFMLFSLGLRQAYVLESHKYGYRTFYYLRLISLFLGSVTCLIIIWITDSSMLSLFFPLCLYRLTELISELQWADYQAKKKFNQILLSQGGRYFICSSVFILLSYLLDDFYVTMWGYAISGFIYVLLMDGRNIYQNIKNDNDELRLLECFKEFVPLSVSLTSMSLQNNGTRFFLGIFGGEYVLGLFTIAYQLYNMPNMIFMAGINFYLKKSGNKSSSEVQLNKLYFISLLFVSATLTFWYLFGGFILVLFFGEEFQVIEVPVIVLLTFTLFRYMAYCHQWQMMNHGKYKVIAKHQFILSILISLTSFFCVYFYSYDGAYAALVFSCLLYYVYFLLLERYESK